jgi:hypothetical protein
MSVTSFRRMLQKTPEKLLHGSSNVMAPSLLVVVEKVKNPKDVEHARDLHHRVRIFQPKKPAGRSQQLQRSIIIVGIFARR